MSSNPSSDVTTVVIEMEPGWVYVKAADPKPSPDRIEFFLRRTIDQWFDAHPSFVIDRAEAITNHGEMLDIHVWYHVSCERPQPPGPVPPLPDSFSIEVHSLIAQKFSKEYVEAVIAEAMKILPSYRHRQDTLVVINPRRVAVLLDKQARRGAVLPVDFIEQVTDGPMKARLQTWLGAPAAPFYVMHITGSWFSERK
jgi:hypothetical protein